jgi:hypothetical protein
MKTGTRADEITGMILIFFPRIAVFSPCVFPLCKSTPLFHPAVMKVEWSGLRLGIVGKAQTSAYFDPNRKSADPAHFRSNISQRPRSESSDQPTVSRKLPNISHNPTSRQQAAIGKSVGSELKTDQQPSGGPLFSGLCGGIMGKYAAVCVFDSAVGCRSARQQRMLDPVVMLPIPEKNAIFSENVAAVVAFSP